jgi:hypothetical protein
MDFSTDQAKSIFALIKEVSPYAYPLLLALLIPIVWISLKKLLGIADKEAEPATDTAKGNILSKAAGFLGSAISLKGDKADRLVFYVCISMFLLGGILLKVGENREEIIRQETLGLKQYFFNRGYIWVKMEDIVKQGYKESRLRTIAHNFPNDFLITDDYITCVDTEIVQKTYRFAMPLLDTYLNSNLTNAKDTICLEELFLPDSTENIRNYFSTDIVYSYLGLPEHKNKYRLFVVNGKTLMVKNETLK